MQCFVAFQSTLVLVEYQLIYFVFLVAVAHAWGNFSIKLDKESIKYALIQCVLGFDSGQKEMEYLSRSWQEFQFSGTSATSLSPIFFCFFAEINSGKR